MATCGASSTWLALCDDTSDAAALKRLARREYRKGSLSFLKYPHLLATAWNILPQCGKLFPLNMSQVKADFHVLQMTATGDHGAFAYDVLWQASGST